MKTFSFKTRIISLFISFAILFSSCASSTLIDSVPSGAKLYLDGEMVGVTPYTMSDTKILGTCTTVRLEKKDFHSYYGTICKVEEADPGAIIGGLFFWFPFLWAMKYKPTHFYKLQEKSENDNDSLDQLWEKQDQSDEQKDTDQKEQKIDNGIIKLDQGNQISPEEFERQNNGRDKEE